MVAVFVAEQQVADPVLSSLVGIDLKVYRVWHAFTAAARVADAIVVCVPAIDAEIRARIDDLADMVGPVFIAAVTSVRACEPLALRRIPADVLIHLEQAPVELPSAIRGSRAGNRRLHLAGIVASDWRIDGNVRRALRHALGADRAVTFARQLAKPACCDRSTLYSRWAATVAAARGVTLHEVVNVILGIRALELVARGVSRRRAAHEIGIDPNRMGRILKQLESKITAAEFTADQACRYLWGLIADGARRTTDRAREIPGGNKSRRRVERERERETETVRQTERERQRERQREKQRERQRERQREWCV